MMKQLEALKVARVGSVIPVLSDTSPSLLITPETADSVEEVRALCRLISTIVPDGQSKWFHIPVGDYWCFRMRTQEGFCIDIMTQIRAVKEAPISL